MKTGSLYTYTFSSDNDTEVTAGDRSFQLHITWPTAVQEQRDNLERQLQELSDSDPLASKEVIQRDYDYLEYYNAIPAYGAGMEAWLAEQEFIPQSIKGLDTTTQLSVLQERKNLCAGLTSYKEDLDDQLHYQITVIDDLNNKYVLDVRLGGWFNNQDNYWAIRFTSAVDHIKQGQLSLVTMEMEIYDQ